MASNNTYKVDFTANVTQFKQQIDEAGNKFRKFSGSMETSIQKVQLGFNGFVKNIGLAVAAIKGAEKAFGMLRDGLTSTKAGQDIFNTVTAQMSSGLKVLERQLTIGMFSTYNTSIATSMRLTKEF
jgi:hypothetical protein